LLKTIGTFKDDKKGPESAYQDSVTAPIGREHDDDAVGLEDEIDGENLGTEVVLREVLTAVEKVSLLVK
jgi:hypothetical protein